MTPPYKRSVTLIELLIAIVILGFLVVSITSIDLFSRSQLQMDDRRASLQNQASSVLEHMQKQLSQAIGDFNNPAVNITTISGDQAIIAFVDDNKNGARDSSDINITYRYNSASYQIWYYPNYANVSYQVVGTNVFNFTRSLSLNYLDVGITVCWDCTQTQGTCGTPANPQLTIINRIALPYVSTN